MVWTRNVTLADCQGFDFRVRENTGRRQASNLITRAPQSRIYKFA